MIDDAPQTLFAMGGHGQNLFVDRANRLVIAKVSSQDSPIDYRAVGLTHLAVPQIRRSVLEHATAPAGGESAGHPRSVRLR